MINTICVSWIHIVPIQLLSDHGWLHVPGQQGENLKLFVTDLPSTHLLTGEGSRDAYTMYASKKKKEVSTFNHTLKKVSLIFSLCSCLTNIGWILRNFFLSSLINCSITSDQIKIYFPHNLSPDGEGNLNQIVTNLPGECIFHRVYF